VSRRGGTVTQSARRLSGYSSGPEKLCVPTTYGLERRLSICQEAISSYGSFRTCLLVRCRSATRARFQRDADGDRPQSTEAAAHLVHRDIVQSVNRDTGLSEKVLGTRDTNQVSDATDRDCPSVERDCLPYPLESDIRLGLFDE
jgi:hypothetical protein